VVEEAITPCVVHDVMVHPDRPAAIEVRFSAVPQASTPAHLRRFSGDQLGLLTLAPSGDDHDWRSAPGAALLQPESWTFRVTRGSYFRRAEANARVTFYGSLPPAAVLRELSPAAVPAAVRAAELPPLQEADPALAASAWAQRALESFAAHRWIELLDPAAASADYRQTAVAWLDPDGRVSAPAELPSSGTWSELIAARARLPEYSLLVCLQSAFGDERWVAISGLALQHGEDLELHRVGQRIDWTLTQIWSAALDHAAGAPAGHPYGVALLGDGFHYRWLGERERDGGLPDALCVVLTPFTAVIDFLVMTNPYLSNLLPKPEGRPEQEPRDGDR
jgi:hypothetical protein